MSLEADQDIDVKKELYTFSNALYKWCAFSFLVAITLGLFFYGYLLLFTTNSLNIYIETILFLIFLLISIFILKKVLPFRPIDFSRKAIVESLIHKTLFLITLPIFVLIEYLISVFFFTHGNLSLEFFSWILGPLSMVYAFFIWQTVVLHIFEHIYGKDSSQTLMLNRANQLKRKKRFNPHFDLDKEEQIKELIDKGSELNSKGVRPSEWRELGESKYNLTNIETIQSKSLKNYVSTLKMYSFYYCLDKGEIENAETRLNELERNFAYFSNSFVVLIIFNSIVFYTYFHFQPKLVSKYLDLLIKYEQRWDDFDELLLNIIKAKIDQNQEKENNYMENLKSLKQDQSMTGIRKMLVDVILVS